MFCKNCGKELPENAKFCSSCGSPVAAPEPQDPPAGREAPVEPVIPMEPETPAEPETPVGETVIPDPAATGEPSTPGEIPVLEDPAAALEPADTGGPEPEKPAAPVAVETPPGTAQDTGAADTGPVKRRGKAGLVVIGVVAVLVIALIALAIKLVGGLVGVGGAAAYAYLNEDGELMYLADLKEKTEALELTDEADLYSTDVRFSPDGKSVYFTDLDGTLYSIAAAELKKGGKPERISRDVDAFAVLKDGRVLYRKYDDNNGTQVSLYDGKEDFRLIRSCYDYQLSGDQKTIYYIERDEGDHTATLYKLAMTKGAKEERLVKGATSFYTAYSADLLVYGVDDSMGGDYAYPSDGSAPDRNTLAVYSCVPGGDKTKLVDDVCSVTGVTVDGGKVSFYYYVEDVAKRTLYDFVTDTNAGADAATLSGEEPAYPYWSDYNISEIWINDDATAYSLGAVYYTNGMGEECPIDASGLVAAGATLEDLYGMYWELYDIAYEDAQERYNGAMADYDERYETWYAAQNREWVRESLKEEQYNQVSYSLYHYTGSGKGEPIATEINSGSRASAPYDGVFLYRKASLGSGKVADVADLDYASEVYDLLGTGSGDSGSAWYQNVGGKESEIDLDGVTDINTLHVLNGKEVVMDAYEDGDNVLRSYALGKDALTFTSTITEDDFSGPYWGIVSGKDVLYLFTDTVDDSDYNTSGDFCVYQDGKLETIAKEVYNAIVLDESGETYVVTDIDTRNQCAELAVVKDGKPAAITDELMDEAPVFLGGGQLLYFSDGDLFLWNGKEDRRIARDVVNVWASVQESYDSYHPY